ncbi:MAG: efflux RND transporter periplasmic adaptor subunit [Acidobacteria bacterium]|nr:efflux RND transporter periplasmic adaptor subunit [Acidobacteriota bacterium]
MKYSTLFMLMAALRLGGCNRKAEPPAESKPHAPEAAGAADDHKDEPNVVKVDPGMQRDLRITTARVESRTGAEEAMLLGQLAVDQRTYAEVGAPVPARVLRLLAAEGDRVRAGQPLAELFSPELGRARADFLTAEARLKLAESALQRKRDLAAERIAPQREVQEAEAAFTEAQAAVRSARAAMAPFGVTAPTGELETQAGSSFVLRSPVPGGVIERTAVIGQMLDPATPAFKVGDLARLWLTVHAFERDAVRISRGSAARLSFAALPRRPFNGVVALVGRQVETESRTIPVRIDVRNESGLLRPGMSASAAVLVSTSGAQLLAVPVAALQRVKNEWCVFLPKGEGTFEIRTVGRGRDLGAEVEILSGLIAGETVVVDGAFLLKAQAEKGQGGHDDH